MPFIVLAAKERWSLPSYEIYFCFTYLDNYWTCEANLRFSIEECLSCLVGFTLLSDGEVFPGIVFKHPYIGWEQFDGNASGAEKADGLDEAERVCLIVAFVELLHADLLLLREEVEYFDEA